MLKKNKSEEIIAQAGLSNPKMSVAKFESPVAN